MTFFIIKRSDGLWRTEIVPVRAGDVDWYGGWDGGLARRSGVEPGKPHYDEISRLTVDDDTGEETALFQVTGVSADESVRLLSKGKVVAHATVAEHGYFVLTAILPWDAEVAVEAV